MKLFLEQVVADLETLAKSLGAKASIYRQDQPLGTVAIMCAQDSLSGPAVVLMQTP
jgi:glucose-1-phosphate thymidylyltransferase